jgi:hypothetical protein
VIQPEAALDHMTVLVRTGGQATHV